MYEGYQDLKLDVLCVFPVPHSDLVIFSTGVSGSDLHVGFLVKVHEDFALLFKGLFVFELAFCDIGFKVDSGVAFTFESGFK